MKSSKTDRIISVVVIGTCLIKAVLYGGSKPPSTTPCFSPRPMMSPPRELTANNQQLTTNVPWHVRGAYCDWVHITFPSGFTFPSGTNLLTGVTVFAFGELRGNLHCSPSTFTLNLPRAISLVPDESTFAHGPTASNSYVFAWDNVCVEREATNRVNASIELFDTGDMTMRFGSTVTNIAARPPEGFSGLNQDDAWIAANFPNDYNAITNKGYSAWLMEDKVGYNEPNGLYKVDVTIAALPDHGPCYLVVGPHKMTVTHPGTYSFPLEVFNEYRAYTAPTRVPLSFDYDDGFRYNDMMSAPPLRNSAPPLTAPRSTPDYYLVCRVPDVVVVPSHIPISQALGARISIFCNVPNAVWSAYSTVTTEFALDFLGPSEAMIRTVDIAGMVVIRMRRLGHECIGIFYIDPAEPWPDPAITNGWDFTYGTNDVSEAKSQ